MPGDAAGWDRDRLTEWTLLHPWKTSLLCGIGMSILFWGRFPLVAVMIVAVVMASTPWRQKRGLRAYHQWQKRQRDRYALWLIEQSAEVDDSTGDQTHTA